MHFFDDPMTPHNIDRCYALYKGDELLSIGTLKEIETATGKSRSWLRYMLFPRYSRRLDSRLCKGKNALRLVVLTEDEE